MKFRPVDSQYSLQCDKEVQYCDTCRKTLKNEPYCRVVETIDGKLKDIWLRCWRCWHTERITQSFIDKYPLFFTRHKEGRWYYLYSRSKEFHFPSSDGENEPDN